MTVGLPWVKVYTVDDDELTFRPTSQPDRRLSVTIDNPKSDESARSMQMRYDDLKQAIDVLERYFYP